jgi:hypothetical protein
LSAKKQTEDKVQIRQFKDNSSQWWVNMAHYKLEQNGDIIWAAGEIDKKELRESLEAYIKRNKKQFKERSVSVFDSEPKQYNEKIGFGEYSELTVSELVAEDLKYAKWILEKCNLAGKEKLKEQLTEILKK